MKLTNSLHCVMWISILRIFATFLIFIFHFRGLFDLNKSGLDLLSISIFCFISGYLMYPIRKPIGKWLEKKYLQLMIPYWLVISLVIIANSIFSYKPKQVYEIVIIFFTGGLFVENPLYVISWYITFMIYIYIMAALVNAKNNILISCSAFLLSIILYIYVIKEPYIYYISFVLGYLLKFFYRNRIATFENSSVNNFLFFLQARCYSFFLIHGGVLLFFVKVMHESESKCFVMSLLSTLIISHVHHEISNTIIGKLFQRA